MSMVWILCQHCHPGLGSGLTESQWLRNFFLYSQNHQTSTCRSINVHLWALWKRDGDVPRCLPSSNHSLKHKEQCQGKAGPACGSCSFPLSPVPVSCVRPLPLLAVRACPALSSGTLVCSQGAEDTNQSSISFLQTIVPGQGAVPALSSHPGVSGNPEPPQEGASWQLQEEKTSPSSSGNSRALSLLSVETGEHSCKGKSQHNPQKWGFSQDWGKNETVQNFPDCIKKNPCEAQSDSYFGLKYWNLISLTLASIVVSLPIFFLMEPLHFAQIKMTQEVPVLIWRDLKSLSLTLQGSLIGLSESGIPKVWYPTVLGKKQLGSAHFNPDFWAWVRPWCWNACAIHRARQCGDSSVSRRLLQQTFSFPSWRSLPEGGDGALTQSVTLFVACCLVFYYFLKDISKCPPDFWRNVLCTLYFSFCFQ